MSEKNTTEAEVVYAALTIDGENVQIDRLKLDKAVQGQLKKENNSAAVTLGLLEDSFWTNIHEDPRVTDENGKPFKTWGLWYADRLRPFELAKELFSKPLIAKLLVRASVREVVSATGWSRGYVHEVNLERQGKPTTKEKKAAAKAEAEKAAKAAPAEGASESGAPELSGLVDAAVSAIDKVVDQIANLSAADLARFSAKVAEGHAAAEAMTGINQVNAAVDAQTEPEVKAPAKPGPRANGKAQAVAV